MKPLVFVLTLTIAAAGVAEEKKVNPRAFRMPSKKAGPAANKAEPAAKEAEPARSVEQPKADTPESTKREERPVAPVTRPDAVEQQSQAKPESRIEPESPVEPEPEVVAAPPAGKPVTSPTAFRLPNEPGAEAAAPPALESPAEPVPTKDVKKKESKVAAPAFTLPGAKPAPAKKKNPVTFRMPEKKKSE